ncbi:hypothetical protein NE237_013605 [Protea cynaroides]|uniref:Growth-regulating factor n=1 Tax=Protea cynaroides TaxID=273540 RepID=A0A9Q0JZ53_9MAGN|nr:hypothetical protein NE237_013605 [Protea cynaroides]
MIMEIDTSTGFIAGKATVASGGRISGSNKLQHTESLPYKMMTMHHNLLLPSSGVSQHENGGDDRDAGTVASAGGDGPASHNGSYKVEGDGGDGRTVARTLQSSSTTSFESLGVMAASLRFPFTSAQWQELERQALIYKYMMASAPVPPTLLVPISRNLSNTAPAAATRSSLGRSFCFNLPFSSGMDPELGRCRRTDGKKWRCSRDAAPEQKYCERHMQRGRPRSRKPVELHLQAGVNKIDGNNMRLASLTPPETASACSPNITSNNTTSTHQLCGLLSQPDLFASYKEPRDVDWLTRGEGVPVAASNQQWPQLMQAKENSAAFRQPYEGVLNLNTYSNFGGGERTGAHHQNDQCFLFLNPEMTSMGVPSSPEQRQMPQRYIDAWSCPSRNGNRNAGSKLSICSDGKLPPSGLTLSTSGSNVSNEDMDHIQMGLGVIASWTPSPPGGPLAEVLRPSSAGSKPYGCCGGGGGNSSSCGGGGGLNLMSGEWGTSADITGSPMATTVSSPSEVLEQTVASVSDSSGSSSPTFTAVAAKSEIAFQWLS